jgi:hypothetical protein
MLGVSAAEDAAPEDVSTSLAHIAVVSCCVVLCPQNFLLTLVQAYVPSLKGVTFEIGDPELFPEVGLWHPLAPCMYEDLKEYLNW